ncbi:MAG: hypothetical protein WD081_06605 [Gammaproteobacteria bacterium]
MRYLIPVILATLLALPAVAAETQAVKTIASVLVDFNHFPSDDDKMALQEVIDADTTSEEEAAVATALMNVQHKVQADDRKALQAIVADPDAASSTKTLAQILLDLSHTPSEEAKRELKTLSGAS